MIDLSVKMGSNVRIGNNVVIETGCEIGDNVFIGNNVVIRPFTFIGKHTKISHLTVVEGWATIGECCNIQAQCNITKGMIIEDKVFIAQGVISGNDKRMVYLRKKPFVQEAPIIRYGARIGMGVVLNSGSEVGREAFIGAGSLVIGKCEEFSIYVGSPAKKIGEVPNDERL